MANPTFKIQKKKTELERKTVNENGNFLKDKTVYSCIKIFSYFCIQFFFTWRATDAAAAAAVFSIACGRQAVDFSFVYATDFLCILLLLL